METKIAKKSWSNCGVEFIVTKKKKTKQIGDIAKKYIRDLGCMKTQMVKRQKDVYILCYNKKCEC